MQEKTKNLIEGRVSKILNDRELVLNRGADSGVRKGMKFRVIEESEEILDPETRESLGSITREKIRVKIDHVEDKLSIGRTYETYTVETPINLSLLSRFSSLYEPSTRVRTLRASSEPATSTVKADLYIVKVGDKMTQLDEENE